MANFEDGNHVNFAGGEGEITKVEGRLNGGQLLQVYTTESRLRKLPGGLPHIGNPIHSLTDLMPNDPFTPTSPREWHQAHTREGWPTPVEREDRAILPDLREKAATEGGV